MRKLLLALLLLLSGCAGESADSNDSALACDHFRNVMGDISDGVLTDAEIRDKLKEVRDNASIATPRIREAASDALAAITTGGLNALMDALAELDAACTAEGV